MNFIFGFTHNVETQSYTWNIYIYTSIEHIQDNNLAESRVDFALLEIEKKKEKEKLYANFVEVYAQYVCFACSLIVIK